MLKNSTKTPPQTNNPDYHKGIHKKSRPALDVQVGTFEDGGFVSLERSKIVEIPETRILFFCELDASDFRYWCEWDWFIDQKRGSASSLWFGGMMDRVVTIVYLVMDDLDDEVYALYPILNDHRALAFLGRLKANEEFTQHIKKQFRKRGPQRLAKICGN